ncbi:Six-hairpin glycosidase [Roridomyces roridus]|uniref:Six-hairpin glycosidase n=1 Tax=Roridomyces roridus TaxID=1738132 RepID=A0AAD7BHG0_9AGAR|nr:Six-hairpin glycosidase [Roridomyces roridus]
MLPQVATVLAVTLFATTKLVEARPKSYAVWAADSVIARGQGNGLTAGVPSVQYADGEFQWGLRLLYERTGNQSYFDWIRMGADNIVANNGSVIGGYNLSSYQLDPLRTGPTFIYMYEQTGEAKFRQAANVYRGQLNVHPRTEEGQFWHKLIYPNQGWLDGVYMGEVFYTRYTLAFDTHNATAWNDITSQFELMFDHTIQLPGAQNDFGLLYHGYDYSHTAIWASPDRGHSPEVWDRALGWYMMALVDVLEVAPANSGPLRPTLLRILNTLVPKLRDAADPTTGAWWLVITQPGRALNYFESSGAAMYIYALLKSVRLGYVEDPHGSIVAAAKKAYGYAVENWVIPNADGTMSWNNTVVVGSLNTDGSFDYYVSQPVDLDDLKGVAAFLLASLEYEKL